MSINIFLSRLTKAKETGVGRYLACCPAHSDKHPSLAIRKLDDGRILVHCFAGCNVKEVLDSVGLTFDALYPDKLIGYRIHPERHPFNAKDILEAVRFEALVVSVAASNIVRGETLVEDDYKRIMLASQRLQAAGAL